MRGLTDYVAFLAALTDVRRNDHEAGHIPYFSMFDKRYSSLCESSITSLELCSRAYLSYREGIR